MRFFICNFFLFEKISIAWLKRSKTISVTTDEEKLKTFDKKKNIAKISRRVIKIILQESKQFVLYIPRHTVTIYLVK